MKRFKTIIFLLYALIFSFAAKAQDTGANPYVGLGHQAVCWNGDSTIYQYHLVQIGKNSNMPKYTRYINADGVRINPDPNTITAGACKGDGDSILVNYQPIIDILDSIEKKLCDTLQVNTTVDFEELFEYFDSTYEARKLDTINVNITNESINVNTNLDSLLQAIKMAIDSQKFEFPDTFNVLMDSSCFKAVATAFLCDYGNNYHPFIRSIQIEDSGTTVVDIDYDGEPYTPSTDIRTGACGPPCGPSFLDSITNEIYLQLLNGTIEVSIDDTLEVNTNLELYLDELEIQLDSIIQCLKDGLSTENTSTDSLLQILIAEQDSIQQLLGDTLTVNATVDFSDYFDTLDSLWEVRNNDTIIVNTGLEIYVDQLEDKVDSLLMCLKDTLNVQFTNDCTIGNFFQDVLVTGNTTWDALPNTYHSISIAVEQEPVNISINGGALIPHKLGKVITIEAEQCSLITNAVQVVTSGAGEAFIIINQ